MPAAAINGEGGALTTAGSGPESDYTRMASPSPSPPPPASTSMHTTPAAAGSMTGAAAAATTTTSTSTSTSHLSPPDIYRPVINSGYPGSAYHASHPHPPASAATSSTSSPGAARQGNGNEGGMVTTAIPIAPGAIPVASPAYPYSDRPYSDRSTVGTYAAPPLGENGGEEGLGGGGFVRQPTAMDQPNAGMVENLDYCTTSCVGTFCKWMMSYIIMITIAAVIAAMFRPTMELGLFLLSILPAITLLSFLETRFRKSVIRMQMLITFFEAVAWMVPIVILENLTNYFLIVRTHLPSEGYCGMCILSDFLQAYLIAGLFEESVKYLAVRRIIYKSYVVDPRALVVYSCCAGSAFGTVEDVMYNLQYGLGTAIVRAFTSVPLHCATGLIIGVSLADRRFFHQDSERWYKTLILPVFIHGTYDFVTFLLSDGYLAVVSFVIGILIVVFSYVYIRKRVLFLLKSFPEELDAHQMMLEGTIDAPGVMCCTPNMCPSCYL